MRIFKQHTLSDTVIGFFLAFILSLYMTGFLFYGAKENNTKILLAETALFFAIFFLHAIFFKFLIRYTSRSVWGMLFLLLGLIGAVSEAIYYQLGIIATPSQLTNVISTDLQEAKEFYSNSLLLTSILFWFPVVLTFYALRFFKISRSSTRISLFFNLICIVLAIALPLSQFNSLASYMRNHKEARYLILPEAPIFSYISATKKKTEVVKEKIIIDNSPSIVKKSREAPLLTLLVVGETARAQNWGLNGYVRDTTPNLRKRDVINFSSVEACGTSTEVSLPCMFSRVGREYYDEDVISTEESVLSVIKRAGVNVQWIDNQSGSKRVSPVGDRRPKAFPQYCPKSENCFDGIFIESLKGILKNVKNRELVVFHMMGSHGPAYYKRSPVEVFKPTCKSSDFSTCKNEHIVNAYDNSILYTDSVLAGFIDELKESAIDAVLLYVSDHGESLGEKGLWLHGAPQWLHIKEQTQVPMILWMNEGALKRFNINPIIAKERASTKSFSHDWLTSTLLTLTEVKSSIYKPHRDLIDALK